ncbi:unnamed protein product [Spirodela intermedia]|uniref:Uncharacterized protein n=1 Tax=Spirodela intermedia TaxID=51605 RepID=A0A7I8KEI3_SPIIN|nr:unnamed protein product [Spirodela intermedia]
MDLSKACCVLLCNSSHSFIK